MDQALPRRGFLGRLLGASAAATIGFVSAPLAGAQESNPDAWIAGVKGRHRALFDFPQHKNGVPLLHVLNYLNTYQSAYKTAAGDVSAVGTFYGIGPQSSIALAFNDAMWSKYALGDYLSLKDASGKAYTHNVFNKPSPGDLHLLVAAMQTPTIPGLAPALPGLGIESLQKLGTTFLLCANALGAWALELEARGKGKASDVENDLRRNLLPGVVIVPAMVIAIEKAQAAGIAYNRQ
jgi:hypothetical protein